jgi:hypothetical protein
MAVLDIIDQSETTFLKNIKFLNSKSVKIPVNQSSFFFQTGQKVLSIVATMAGCKTVGLCRRVDLMSYIKVVLIIV